MRLLLPLLLVLSAGCDSATNPSAYTQSRLTLLDASLPPEAGVTELTPSSIDFLRDGTFSVRSCNSCDGTYAWDDNLLRVGGLGCTEIACGPRLDLGEWLVADRIVASDAEDDQVTLVAERDGLLASFLFTVSDLDSDD